MSVTQLPPAVSLPGGYKVLKSTVINLEGESAFVAKVQYTPLSSPIAKIDDVEICALEIQLVSHPSDNGADATRVAAALLPLVRKSSKTQEDLEAIAALKAQLLVRDVNVLGYMKQGDSHVPVFRAYINNRGADPETAQIAITGGIGLPVEEYKTKDAVTGKERTGKGVSTEKSFLNSITAACFEAMIVDEVLLEVWGEMRFMETRGGKTQTVTAEEQNANAATASSTTGKGSDPFAGMGDVEDLPATPPVGEAEVGAPEYVPESPAVV